jgi:hypothetical protein
MSDDLDELLRLHGKATGGEWHVNEFDDDADEVERYQIQTNHRQRGDLGGTVLAVYDAEWILPRQAKANAELAVAAHNALPGLVERVRRAEANLSFESVCESERVAREALGAGARELTHEAAIRVVAERDALREVARRAQQIADDYESGPVSLEPLLRALAKVPR